MSVCHGYSAPERPSERASGLKSDGQDAVPVVEVSRGGFGVAGLEECAGEVGAGIVEAADPVG